MAHHRTGLPPTPPERAAGAATRRVATLVAFVLGIASLAIGLNPVATAGAQVAPAQVTVSKATGIDPAGETVIVTGTGFDPNANVGTRPPLAGQKSGIYVTFGRYADVWKPSAGAAAGTREAISQKWALPAASRAILDPTGTGEAYATLNADGTFSVELPVLAGGTSAGNYGIVTYAGGGAVNASHETFTPISFGPPAPTWDPTVSVSKSTGIDVAGETVTVTGSGFDPDANVGTRPPLAGQRSGIYVTFGRYADVWQPSTGAAATTREALSQKWALPAASRAILDPNGTGAAYATLNADGTFTAELTVAPGGTTTGDYGIVTYAGGGAVNADHETFTAVSFGDVPPAWDPQVAVAKTTDIDEAGETVTVTGSGFDPAADLGAHPPLQGQPAGVYVAFGRYAETWQPSAGAAPDTREGLSVVWALPAASRAILDPSGTGPGFATLNADGTFSVDLQIAPGGTTSGAFGVVTYAGGGAVNADHETFMPITFATTPPEPVPGTGTGKNGQILTVTPFSELDPDGQDLVVEGTGYDPAIGVYVALCVDKGPNVAPSPCVGGSGESSGSSSSAWITDDDQWAGQRTTTFGPGGTFEVTIHVTASDEFMDCYDEGTTCVVATRADHTASSNRTADVKVPVYFTGQVVPVDPDPEPEPTAATINVTSVVAGGEVTVAGEGFLPGEQVQVWLHSDPQLMGVVVADAVGKVDYSFIVPATTEAGTHHVELYGITSALRLISPSFSVVAAAIPAAVAATPTTTTVTTATATATTGSLPVTGSTLVLPVAGVVLLALGLVLAGPARRRRTVPAGD